MIRNRRPDGDQLRPVTIERGYVRNSPGSVLYRGGRDAVLVTAQRLGVRCRRSWKGKASAG